MKFPHSIIAASVLALNTVCAPPGPRCNEDCQRISADIAQRAGMTLTGISDGCRAKVVDTYLRRVTREGLPGDDCEVLAADELKKCLKP